MKVAITKLSKEVITVAEMPTVKKMIEGLKDTVLNDEAKALSNLFENGCEILKASAEIAKNRRVWGYYDVGENHSKDFDVWLEVTFKSYDRFYEVGAYLSDIWQIGGEDIETLKSRMYIQEYVLRGR